MVIWKNTDLATKGIIVEKTPTISKAKKRIDAYEIAGRNGVLVIDNGTYDTFVCSVECHIDINTFDMDTVKAFLDGYGAISFDGVRQYQAYIKNAIDFEKVMNFRKFLIQFECQPIAQDINSTTIEIEDTEETFNITGATANMYPTLKIRGYGNVSITINNKTFYLYDLARTYEYTLDCENKEIVDQNGVNCSDLMKYDFPYLVNGTNTVSTTGNIGQLTIIYKKSYI